MSNKSLRFSHTKTDFLDRFPTLSVGKPLVLDLVLGMFSMENSRTNIFSYTFESQSVGKNIIPEW